MYLYKKYPPSCVDIFIYVDGGYTVLEDDVETIICMEDMKSIEITLNPDMLSE